MIKKISTFIFAFIIIHVKLIAQDLEANTEVEDSSWKTQYKAFATKEHDLTHAKLVAHFDFNKAQLNGEVWLTAHPHFYATQQIVLDAKGMEIHKVSIGNKSLRFAYDGMLLKIDLDKTYTRKENFTIYVQYTAKPNDYKGKGSAAITDAKGLYFINPKGLEKNKPTQIWTQGETEGTSVWMPIIDKPNQKLTQEFQLYVPKKYVSLSNGKLIQQIPQKDSTRLDIWKMDQVHAPYLFFIGMGEYAIIKDQYKGKEVSYYIEKPYESVARKIYGKTPSMIAFYEKITGVLYPWVKYSQISGRDYVSGAMENTTCTLHSDAVQQDARELKDGNAWETVIAHELFHHWFGDLVTAESWSNLTVNESFADYSETLWMEHDKGKDAGDYENFKAMRSYLNSPSDAEKDLVRFFYKDREDMFDVVSYQKGGRILHMLRHLVGDDAFFASLNKYLEDNKYANGSALKLKLAFESITGKDLNWFFNQWYFGNGHPYVRISHQYLAEKSQVQVIIQQTQTQNKLFKLPVDIDVYVNNHRNSYQVWSEHKSDTFYFAANSAPNNVNVDADKILLWVKDESKPLSYLHYQFHHARNLMDRFEAINEASENMKNSLAQEIIQNALSDSFYVIRAKGLHSFNPNNLDSATEKKILKLASEDRSNEVKEEAIDVLGGLIKPIYRDAFYQWTKDSSYIIAGAALEALEKVDSTAAKQIAFSLTTTTLKKRLNTAVSNIVAKYGDESVFDFIADKYATYNIQSAEKFYMTSSMAKLLIKTKDATKFKKGIDLIVAFREAIPQGYRTQTDPYFNGKILGEILKAKKQAGENELASIVATQLPQMSIKP